VAGVHRQVAERQRQVGLADAGRADQQAVGMLFDEPQGGEFADQLAVDAGLGVEVEVLQPPGGGEGGKPQPAGVAAGFGGVDLDGEQALQERGVAELLGVGMIEGGGQRLGGGVQAQVVQVASELLVGRAGRCRGGGGGWGRGGHWWPPLASSA
jgi:hypothetical protein